MDKLILQTLVLAALLGILSAEMSDQDILRYLEKYGYAGESNPSENVARLTRTNVSMAIQVGCMMFQKKNHLHVTGNCNDRYVLRLMEKPRCGNLDISSVSDMEHMDTMLDEMLGVRPTSRIGRRRRRKRYAATGDHWPKTELTYSITEFTPDLDRHEVERDITLAFKAWSDVTPLTFTRVAFSPDIEIRFTPTVHGDGFPFDGEGQTLAHAFYPRSGGDVHFDEAEKWTIDSRWGIDLFTVAVHEFGHSLGLSHSDISGSIMQAFYGGREPIDEWQMHDDDIAGIQSMYGYSYDVTNITLSDEAERIENMIFPGIAEGAPNFCEGVRFDAVFTHATGGVPYMYAFSGEYYMQIGYGGLTKGYPRLIAKDFNGLRRVDAALNTGSKSYLFSGENYYHIQENSQLSAPRSIAEDIGVAGPVDAAFRWDRTGKAYLTTGGKFFTLTDEEPPKISDQYPRDLKDWTERINWFHAAFQNIDGDIYFFAQNYTYRYNDTANEVGYGFQNHEVWLECSADHLACTLIVLLGGLLVSLFCR